MTLTGLVASALDSVDDGAEDVSDGWSEQEQDGDYDNSHQN